MNTAIGLYNVALWAALVLLAPVIAIWLAFSQKLRSGLRQKLALYPPEFLAQLQTLRQSGKPVVWFHAVSVGEFNAIRALVKRLNDACLPVISTTTHTGQGLARRVFPDLPVFYFPLDFAPFVRRALDAVRPDLAVLVETEIWPNFIHIATQRKGVPVILINGRLSPGSFKGYRWLKALMAPVLRCFDDCYMQSESDAQRLIALGAPPEIVHVAGNLKFDMPPAADDAHKTILRRLLGFGPRDIVVTFASSHRGEEELLLPVFLTLRKDFPELKFVIAPRHPERVAEVRALLNARGLPYRLRSQLSEAQPNEAPFVILDTIGELVTVYALSTLAVMGGSFVEHGGQNPLEPLSRKIPVIFGPHMFNFADISQRILEHHAGMQAQTPQDVISLATQLLTQPENYSAVVENGQRLLQDNRGALESLARAIQTRVGVVSPPEPPV
ncbi:MAG: 3-deoxy-D-manno-octulosonic acid transferase [Vampirovibrionales bacterium]|nr:3-deoxy-D-manno-octulosonic acid transferase [Vampirovibrionales bacterium]